MNPARAGDGDDRASPDRPPPAPRFSRRTGPGPMPFDGDRLHFILAGFLQVCQNG